MTYKYHKGKESLKKSNKSNYRPMLAKLSSTVFDHKDWIYERKLDGYRILAYTGDQPHLISRNLIDYTQTYPSIAKELAKIKEFAILDGELVAENKEKDQKFQWLQNYQIGDKNLSLKYFVFDLLSLNGLDITTLALIKRKELLAKLLSNYTFSDVYYLPHVVEKGKLLFEEAGKKKWEGIIGKKADGPYYIGKRTNSWLKLKFTNSQEALICGYTTATGARKYFGALVLGIFNQGELQYIGNCGTGFNEDTLKDIYDKISILKTDLKPFNTKVNQERNATWVQPTYVCEVNYTEWTEEGHLRHPVFKGLRIDKDPTEVVKEEKVEIR